MAAAEKMGQENAKLAEVGENGRDGDDRGPDESHRWDLPGLP